MRFNPGQHQIDFANSREKYVGLFGGVGNGKTTIACRKMIEKATRYPNNLLLVGRLTYPELRDSTREVFLNALMGDADNPPIYPPEAYSFNKSENSITFWNKSVVVFRHLDDPRCLLGPNLGGFYVDQAEEVDEESFLTLQSRLRRPNVGRLQGYITGNPRGHDWIFYKFGMNEAGDSKDWCFNQDYRMITAPTFANIKNLPSDYIDQLKRSYSKEWFERYVNGSWDVFEGQIFNLCKIQSYDVLPKILMVVTACDPAISKETYACNTSFTTLGYGEDGNVYDLETVANKWSFLETLDQARKIIINHKPTYLGVESVGYQQALFEACQRYFPNIQVLDLKADKDKVRRAKSVTHIIDKGLFRTNNKELLDEMSAFGAQSAKSTKHKKDRVDSLVHALHMIQRFSPLMREKIKDPIDDLPYHEWFFAKAMHQMDRGEPGDTETSKGSYSQSSKYY